MSDLIDRQATYLALVEKGQASKRYKLGETWELNGKEIREVLDALPSVQPEPRTDGDTISRQAAIDAIRASTKKYTGFMKMEMYTDDDAVEAIEGLPSVQPDLPEWAKKVEYHDPFGNPIYVYVRVGDKTVTIKADDLQKALDYVTEHGEEVTIEGRRKAMVEELFDAPDAERRTDE